jgi:UDP-N-acetylmuramate--alanine ligase
MSFSVETEQQPLTLDPSQPLHFVGIGGVGMSGLAKILLEAGYTISGSDVTENAYTQQVVELGCALHIGHAADNVPENAALIVSSSINRQNPEIAKALDLGLAIHHRSILLREILQGARLGHESPIGITGTHGKTSITGMTGLALIAAGLDPTIIVGGKMPQLKTNAVWGQSKKYAVAELDESDGTIVQYQPALSVVANLELDHADHYTNGLQGVMDTFRQYLGALKPGSKVFYNVTCPNTKLLAEENPAHVEAILIAPADVFTGQESQTTYWLKNARHYSRGCYQGYVYRNAKMLGELSMSVPGKHNLFNGLCAVAVGDQLGADFDALAESLNQFTGMGRRFEKVGELNNALLIDDYAHHPSEVLVTLKAAKESLHGSSGRVIAIFQPHRYTRLQALWDDFAACFNDADLVYLTDVYSAHEPEIPGVTSEALVAQMAHPNAQYISQNPGFTVLRDALTSVIQPGDVVLSMGAGNITQLLRQWAP